MDPGLSGEMETAFIRVGVQARLYTGVHVPSTRWSPSKWPMLLFLILSFPSFF